MSAKVESTRIGGHVSFGTTTVIAIALVVATMTGVFAVRAIVDRGDAETAFSGSVAWDAGKLEAMEGRQLAAVVAAQAPVVWDAGKLEAIEGRQLAERFRGVVGWDAGRLEAIEGRQLAEEYRSDGAFVKPHVPKR